MSVKIFLALALSLLSTLMSTLVFSGKESLVFFFLSVKVRAGDVITAETSGVLEMQNFTSSLT